jgi:hypothetical protein
MKQNSTVSIAFPDEESFSPALPQNQMLPLSRHIDRLKLKSVEVSKEVIAESLEKFIQDIDEILAKIPLAKKVEIDEVTLSVGVTAEGGIQWIASVNSGASSSMTLKFKIKKDKNGAK